MTQQDRMLDALRGLAVHGFEIRNVNFVTREVTLHVPELDDRAERVAVIQRDHGKLAAVKLHRELFGTTLAEAKTAVEAMGPE